jgi:6-phosphofructokinase
MSELHSLAGKHVNVAMMTSGGLAPCLSCSIAQLFRYWVQALAEERIAGLEFRMYLAGYKGILTGESFIVPQSEWETVSHLNFLGGSPIGNSRVKVGLVYGGAEIKTASTADRLIFFALSLLVRPCTP